MSKRLLVVDDDAEFVDEASRLLELDGFEVQRAYDGRQALQTLVNQRDREPCVILLDLGMPVMDGWQLLAVMRSYARLSRIPIVLYTAHEVPAHVRPAFRDILRKPVEANQLVETVRRVCGCGTTPRAA